MYKSSREERIKVCFVRPDAIRLFEPGASGQIGGAQVRSFTFAKALADREAFEVSFVLNSDRVRRPQQYDGVTVHFRPSGSTAKATRRLQRPGFVGGSVPANYSRFVGKIRKGLGLVSAESISFYRNVDADIYCCFGVSEDSANAIRASKRLGGKSVLFTVLDKELETSHALDPTASQRLHRKLQRFRNMSLSLSDAIVVQTKYQQERLSEQFGRPSSIIRNPVDMRPAAGADTRPSESPYALWVGRAETFHKRADRLVSLARLVPQVNFLAIVNRFPGDSIELLSEQQPSNVTIVEGVPFGEIERYFAGASVFLSTSDFEGFPNTFLQAAKHRVPVLSYLVDPNEMLSKHGCGGVAHGDLSQMADLVRHVCDGGIKAQQMGHSAHRYAETYHALDGRVDELAAVLCRLSEPGEGTRCAA